MVIDDMNDRALEIADQLDDDVRLGIPRNRNKTKAAKTIRDLVAENERLKEDYQNRIAELKSELAIEEEVSGSMLHDMQETIDELWRENKVWFEASEKDDKEIEYLHNEVDKKEQRITELEQENERLREIINTAHDIGMASPELNMSNYDRSQVTELNNAMNELCCYLEEQKK